MDCGLLVHRFHCVYHSEGTTGLIPIGHFWRAVNAYKSVRRNGWQCCRTICNRSRDRWGQWDSFLNMPLLFIGTGLVMVLVGLNGDASKLYQLLAADFSGPGSFIYWVFAIIILGSLGYIKGLENFSKMFLILVLIVLFLDNGGFFAQFQAYLKSTQATPATATQAQSGAAPTAANPATPSGAGQ
jgi:hypothetical protein